MAKKITTKRTPERAQKIADAIQQGATYELAAAYGGISADTFTRWRNSDPAFREKILIAEGKAAMGWLLKIERAANQGHWRAAAWKLEKRYPEQYGRQVLDSRHSAPSGGPIEIRAVDYRIGLGALKPEDEREVDAPEDGDEAD